MAQIKADEISSGAQSGSSSSTLGQIRMASSNRAPLRESTQHAAGALAAQNSKLAEFFGLSKPLGNGIEVALK
jgi:hypothetical protein